MGFSTENRTISEIFQRQARYVVPRYQREYVWTKRNWDELLTDVSFTLSTEQEGIETQHKWTHFLGTIVLNSGEVLKSSEEIKGIKDYEIIDGQQRLTTVFVLVVSLCSLMFKMEDEEAEKRAEYLESSFINSRTTRNELIPVLYNSDYENEIKELLQVMRETKNTNLSADNPYKNVYENFYNGFVDKTFAEIDEFVEELLAINIVEIVSSQEEEIYNIFEVLNARGQQLKQIELLKNHIMKYTFPRVTDYIDKARLKWNEIYENTKILSDRDDLLNHFAKCYIKRKANNAEEVYKLFKEEIPFTEMSHFLDDLYAFSKIYAEINEKENNDKSIEYFNIKNNKQIKSLLSSIIHLEKSEVIDKETKEKTFINLRNFFFIFNASQNTSNRTDNYVKNAAYSIYHCQTIVQYKFEISKLFYEISRLIDKNNFLNMYYLTLKYSNKDRRFSSGKLIKYILVELLSCYQGDTKLESKDLTIEHLLGDNGDTEHAQIHNLTLTNEEINSAHLENKPIKEKLSILAEESSIVLNTKLGEYLKEDDSFDSEKRKRDLGELLYNKIFLFDPAVFNLEISEITKFFEIHGKLLKHLDGFNVHQVEERNSTEELIKLLLQRGPSFEIQLNNDPSKEDSKKYYELIT